MRLTLPFLAALAMPVTAAAHPHVFVQAQVTVVFDAAGDIGIKLDWYYDDLFSLLVTTDLGIDMDGDLVLTAQEQALLDSQIAAWPPEYDGDLEVAQGAVVLALGDKQDHSMTYVEGLFVETHLRPLPDVPDPTAPIQIRVYDPSFYTAYELRQPVVMTGRDDCSAEIVPADVDAAYALAARLLDGRDAAQVGPDEYFPAVGDAFADTIIVTCASPL